VPLPPFRSLNRRNRPLFLPVTRNKPWRESIPPLPNGSLLCRFSYISTFFSSRCVVDSFPSHCPRHLLRSPFVYHYFFNDRCPLFFSPILRTPSQVSSLLERSLVSLPPSHFPSPSLVFLGCFCPSQPHFFLSSSATLRFFTVAPPYVPMSCPDRYTPSFWRPSPGAPSKIFFPPLLTSSSVPLSNAHASVGFENP